MIRSLFRRKTNDNVFAVSSSASPRDLNDKSSKSGFTIIEVSLFLAITGLLLIGLLGGTYASIATQRYNDSVRSFAEFLRQVFGEVISPETLGGGNSNQSAIYGKIIVFGLDNTTTAYTATLIGDVKIPDTSGGFMNELRTVNARLFCGIEGTAPGSEDQESTVSQYTPLWQTRITAPDNSIFEGTVIIARSPTSGTIHTYYSPQLFDIKNHCHAGDTSASSAFAAAVQRNSDLSSDEAFHAEAINFCLRSENSMIVRDVLLGRDANGTSAINTLADDDPEVKCR